jgi:hypothetical protein
VNTIPAWWRSIFGVRWNGGDDAVLVSMIMKTAMGFATKNLAASGDESLLGARLSANCDQAGYEPQKKALVPRFCS